MGRSRRSPDVDDVESRRRSAKPSRAVGAAIVRNPVLVGGVTAFIVALSYVSANALWYQPHFHSGAFFATRSTSYAGPPDPAAVETTIRIERQSEVVKPVVKPDPVVEQVQSILHSMNLYAGDVDGISGPNTRKAIDAYQQDDGHGRFRAKSTTRCSNSSARRQHGRHQAEAAAAPDRSPKSRPRPFRPRCRPTMTPSPIR